jgi:ribonuclease J
MSNKDGFTSVVALGGLGEIGKNMYVITHKDEIFIVDAGVLFPEDELLGVDYVIQDITYLKQNANKIKGLLITHGHEDHIGGIPFLLTAVNIPAIYGAKTSIDLIRNKLEDRGTPYDFNNLKEIDEDTIIKTKYFQIEFITVTHSIPDCYSIVLRTPNGIILHTGDYKFDLTPIGPVANFQKLARFGDEGVRLLLGESTNALVPGFSASENIVDEALADIVNGYPGRIIIATFASNIFRVKHIVETCRKNNRKIVVFGRSMETATNLALNNGLITDKSIFIDSNTAKGMKKNEICILCTGSQGEPLAALSRIAAGTHKQISLLPDDLVVFSSNPIPGNAASINRVINKLYLKGVKVITNSDLKDIHTSGHAKQDELKLMLRLLKPEYFMPIHGEYRMLKQHRELAISCDVKEDNIFILNNGDTLIMDENSVHPGSSVTAGDVYVDGSRIGEIGSVVIKDRKLMSRDGILITILNINPLTRKLLIKPNITTRGFILVNENAELIEKIEKKTTEVINNFLSQNTYTYTDLKNQIILELHPFISNLTGRHPIILPVIMEVRETSN